MTALCQCGCGEPAPIAQRTNPGRSVRGQPQRFILGHHGRKPNPYLIEDRGYKTPCWIWQLGRNEAGYGRVMRSNRCRLAHRWMYEQLIGPIPEGLTLDHLCRVHPCVNPEHLEPVTAVVNIRRGGNATKTHCPYGHEYTEANTYWYAGWRSCRECRLRQAAANRAQRRQEQAA